MIGTLAAVAANVPFFSEKIFFFRAPQSGTKNFFWRLLEMMFLFVLVGGFARFLESRFSPVHEQNWQFYASALALFLVLAWPGFVWRFFWRKPGL
ncbi:DUF2818 family protein [Chitinibacter bivalviorum]|uniref:DUF2818 family protein n=1 Tax=Chitinibacter bivalviorum TaxID=2739434 RepID=UPI001FE81B27|nr:DUF2818 family protein [Chitinibacter bivalviorum]